MQIAGGGREMTRATLGEEGVELVIVYWVQIMGRGLGGRFCRRRLWREGLRLGASFLEGGWLAERAGRIGHNRGSATGRGPIWAERGGENVSQELPFGDEYREVDDGVGKRTGVGGRAKVVRRDRMEEG